MNAWTPPAIVGFRERIGECGTQDLMMHDAADHLGITVAESVDAASEDVFGKLQIPLRKSFPTGEWVLLQRGPWLDLVRPDGVRLGIDFTTSKTRHRMTEVAKGIQPLARALGLSAHRRHYGTLPIIIDATGGLGQDAWALAAYGCEVCIVEQHPIVHALLANALARAAADEPNRDIARRIRLVYSSAQDCLLHLAPALVAHAIYLDPMYPERKRKKADSRKGMQILHALLGPADDTQDSCLLQIALQCPVRRIVVKRPRGAPTLGSAVEFDAQLTCIESPNTRHDVYHLPQS